MCWHKHSSLHLELKFPDPEVIAERGGVNALPPTLALAFPLDLEVWSFLI